MPPFANRCLIVWLILCSVAWSDTPPATPAGALEELLVTGERPGPGMWRVSNNGHDLWILATLEPLPKKMLWRSQVVAQRIADSQAVIAPPSINADVGFFRGLTLIPSLLRARKSPDGRTLQQVLPHDLYIRWLALRVKYLGNSDDEHRRPMLAALDVYWHALDQSGLTIDDNVWDIVEKLAHKNHVPILPVLFTLPVDDAKGSIRELDRIPPQAEIACFTKTVERLETDLQPMRQRANFWALGDVAGLRSLPYPDERSTCLNAFLEVPKFRDQLESARTQIMQRWLGTAEAALEKNSSSFAVLPMSDFLQPDGLLSQLRAKGYTVVEPQ